MTLRSKTRITTPVALLVAAAFLGACGSNSSSASSSVTTPTSNATTVSTDAALATKPTVTVPNGPAPTTLQSTDLIVGTGAEAKNGDTVTVQYVGVNYADGKQFDASWDDGQPFTFKLGAGQVIKGWDEGVVGMKEGGRRQLVIPPSLGYGDQAQGPIVPNETLVFVIDLLSVKS